ncbi:MAG: DNA translocase FtsK 4TM domain-containing protein, partial [Bacteroidia bacterium]|nr:DNA translocase FtsK 4TM domain-containing protein [Bacteroidia bacterium]
MAKKKTAKSRKSRSQSKKNRLALSRPQKVILGSGLMLFGIALFFSFVSHLFNWKADQSIVGEISRESNAENWLEDVGNFLGNFFIHDGFGLSAFIIAFLVTLTGIYFFFNYARKQLLRYWFWGLLVMVWLSVFFGFFAEKSSLLSGVFGFEINDLLQDFMGLLGTILVMTFLAIIYLVLRLKLTPEKVGATLKKTKKDIQDDFVDPDSSEEIAQTDYEKEVVETLVGDQLSEANLEPVKEVKPKQTIQEPALKQKASHEEVTMEVETAPEEEEVSESLSKKLVEDFGEFDPTLELGNYKFPTIDLLKDYTGGQGITINQEELEANKNRIVETLNNYKIGIANIKATVGPTVTLYEIVPDAGVRISRIKNLEDDIALSLSALGIRIIAPIPGRGTIGIEVPNKKPQIVSMRSAIASPKFQNAEMQLPLTLGKTISNETFVVDLAKMPHLLMAGATG